MEIVSKIAEKIVEYTFAPVGQWLCYSFHYNSNMENLKNQEKHLQDAKNRVQHSVTVAERKGELIEGDVETWLRNATTKLNEIEAKAGNRSSNAACLNLPHRHRLSREAKKMVENIAQLLDEYHKNRNFEKVSYRPPPEGMETTRNMDYMAMESRITAVKEIMEALRNADIDKIGVWGMPGVGKSTLMKEIARQAREEKLFNEVVMAVVTDSPDVRRIQGEIAYTLGLNFDQEIEKGRASQLNQRLSSNDKKILVILDDIWKELDLQEIGIPSKGCKVVMTSRDRDVLICGMGTRKDIELEILQEAEACNLIEKIAGDSFEDQPEVRGVAIEIAKKCAGLPIALVAVSKALKNKSLSEWRDRLRQLKRPAPEHITEEPLKTIYPPIKVSYDNLEPQELKSLFLLCALLPYFLSYLDLLKYSYGWGLFGDIYTLEEARDRLDRRLRELKDSCLLLERSDGFCMHDLVRDVATIIASKDNNMFVMRDEGGLKEYPDVDALKRCKAFSTFDQLPNEMECPELIFLHISSKSYLQIPNTLFQGMEKLKVLDLPTMLLTSLPSSLLVLRNLQTLCLDHCMLEDISGIGELKNLVVLSLLHSQISKLPREIGSLVRLRMLDLSKCYELEMIPPNVISSLVKLEELYMGNSIVQWEVEGLNDERKNASLAELKHLSNLNTLEIQIPDVSKLPKDFNFEKLVRYKICIGDVWDWSDNVQSSRTLKLKLNSSIQSEFWNKMPSNRVEILHLEGRLNGVMSVIMPETDREVFQQMKYLRIHNGVQLKYIVNLSTSVVVFPTLETFILSNMIKLEEICQGELPSTSFKKLRVLKLENCEKLRFVFSSSIARGLSLLEKLEIRRCNSMGAIVVKEEKDGIEDGDVVLFHQLQTLVLEDLPELVSFLSTRSSFTTDCGQIIAEGNHDLHMPLLHYQVAFPNLKRIYLRDLPKIKRVYSKDPQTILKFQNLQEIDVSNCASLKSLFPASIGTCLKQLKEIRINDCEVLEEIFEGEGGEAMGRMLVFEFPQVTSLDLIDLPRLKCFYKGLHISQWPMLKNMWIRGCGKVEVFASGLVSFEETIEERQYSQMLIKQPLFSVDEMSFSSLEILKISKMEKLEIIWYGQVAASPTTLHISDCGSLEVVFEQHQGQNGKESHALIVTQRLRQMYLSNLPKLRNIWNVKDSHQRHMYSFPNLLDIYVKGCESLKSLFPAASVAASLTQLESLKIEDCGVMEEIVAKEDGTDPTARLLFTRLTLLNLDGLPKLKWFYQGVRILESSSSKELDEHGGTLFGIEEVAFPNLTNLNLCGLSKIKHVWSKETVEERQSQTSIKQPLFLVDEMSFPSLEILKISKMEKLEIIWNITNSHQRYMCSFPNLLHIDVSLCESLKSLFPAVSVVAILPQLQSLVITGCWVLEKIVEREDGTDPTTRLLFPSLIYLGLYRLPKFKWFFQGVHTLKSSSSKELHEQGGTLFVVEEVDFPSLKLLDLYGLPKIKHVWSKDSQTILSFQNLQVIIVGKCVSLKSLFPASIVRCLEQLEKIKIYDCGVDEIVAAEGGEAEEITLVFPQVTSLCLENLERLEGVHESKWSILKEMRILECEKVKLSFPRLVTLEIRRMYKLEITSRNVTGRKLWRSCYARCLHAVESYRLRRALMPNATDYELEKMRDVWRAF